MIAEITGWVAPLMADRLRSYFGIYHWDEFHEFAEEIGVIIVEKPLGADVKAFRVQQFVFIDSRLGVRESARCAWHEIAHVLMHPANGGWWDQLPWGDIMIGKEERQAWEFVETFPEWGDEPHSFLPDSLREPNM